MNLLIAKDNNRNSEDKPHLDDDSPLGHFAGKTLKSLMDSGSVVLFPSKTQDLDESQPLFTLDKDRNIITGNIMGFISRRGNCLKITSRFSDHEKDYFLHYMLAKTLHYNVSDLEFSKSSDDNFHRLLIYLFPRYLNTALRKGVYHEYVKNEYNDAKISGPIDIKRHIKFNTPFIGKFAFHMRELEYDNPMTQLVRHTIEHIRQRGLGKILSGQTITKENIQSIEAATASYRYSNRQKIIRINGRKMIRHSYFFEYQALQKLCLGILQEDKISYGSDRDNVFGILFDGAALWEEYINKIIGNRFEHPNNRDKTGGYSLFIGGAGRIYPDFISYDKKIIADAKYKPAQNIKGADYLQLVAYMYRFDAKCGIYIYPRITQNMDEKLIINNKDQKSLFKFGLGISKAIEWTNFCDEMSQNEHELMQNILKLFCGYDPKHFETIMFGG